MSQFYGNITDTVCQTSDAVQCTVTYSCQLIRHLLKQLTIIC